MIRAAWSRRKWLAILCFIVPFTAGASYVVFLPNVYQSTATVAIDRQQVPEILVRSTVTSELETRLRTISQDILSRSRLDGLIIRFGLYTDLKHLLPLEAVIQKMRSDIRLELKSADARGRGSTTALAISYRGRDPEIVAQVTNTLASFFVEENLKARERQATGTARFLEAQLQETRKKLDERERQISAFKKRYVGELPQQMPANLATLEQLNAQLRLNSVNLMRLEEKRDLLTMQLPDVAAAEQPATSSPPPPRPAELQSPGQSPGTDSARQRLVRLKAELDDLTSRFTAKYPDVVRKQAEITALERRIAQEGPEVDRGPEPGRESPPADASPSRVSTPPPAVRPPLTPQTMRLKQALAEVEGEIKVLKGEDSRLRKALAVHEQRVTDTPRREQEFQELSRDYDSTKELYQSLVKRHDEAQLAENMEQRQQGEQLRVLDPAVASLLPAEPNRFRMIMVILVLSLAASVTATAVREALDTSFHTMNDLRDTIAAPLVISIPSIVTETDAVKARWRFRLATAATLVVLLMLVPISYLLATRDLVAP